MIFFQDHQEGSKALSVSHITVIENGKPKKYIKLKLEKKLRQQNKATIISVICTLLRSIQEKKV